MNLKLKMSLNIIIVLSMTTLICSCAKDDNSSLQTFDKFLAKPLVKDGLIGKSKAEILKIKYKELKLMCGLNTVKATRGQFLLNSTGTTPTPIPVQDSPLSNPSESSVAFDLKLKQNSQAV